MALLCPLETHSLHFSLEHLCVFFNDCRHSSTARQGVLIESLMRNYLFIFHKHLPLHSSSPSSSPLWGSGFGAVKVLASFHGKLGKWGAGMSSGCYLTSHGALHGMLVLSERRRHRHTPRYRFQLCRGSCLWVLVTHACSRIVTLNLLILPLWLVGIPPQKDIPHELTGAKQCLRASLKDYLMRLRSHLPPSQAYNTHLLCSILRFYPVQWESPPVDT